MAASALALVRGRFLPAAAPGTDSVLVEADRVTRIGTAKEILDHAPPGAEIIDLRGRTLSPGFHDAHFHFLQTGIKSAHPSLRVCRSLEDVADAVADAVRRRPDRGILIFDEWDETQWAAPAFPTRAGLDRVAPERAVILRRVDDHTAVANTAGLKLLAEKWSGPGIDPDTGVCREDPVLMLEELFPPHAAELREAFATAARLCFSVGITTASDFLRPYSCRAYAELFAGCHPVPRIDAYLWVGCLDDPSLAGVLPRSDRLRVPGIKAWADGSVGAREAALFEEYRDRPGARGTLTYPDEELRAIVRRGHEAEMSVAVHAIGDRAIAQVLDAFEALPAGETRGRGHRIEHFELPRPADIGRAAALGVRPCVQPNFVGQWAGADGLYETALGPERLRRMNPLRTLVREETGVFFGSDGMPTSPLFGIRSALRHPVSRERLTLEEAHHLYTAEAAAAVEDPDPPRLEPGARADLIVLAVPPDGIEADSREEVDLTVLAGSVVHRRPGLEGAAHRC